jgi:hypothetical protein
MPRIKSKAAPSDEERAAKKKRKDLGAKTKAHIRYSIPNPDGSGKKFNIPGVTTVTGQFAKPFLIGWANRLGLEGTDSSKYTDEARDIGNAAHYLIESKLRNEVPNVDDFTGNQIDRASFGVKAFDDWASEHTVEPQLLEAVFTSETYRYGGQLDFYGLLDGKPTLLDFKTSSDLYPEHGWQVAAYWKLLREAGHEVKGVRILRIGRTDDEGFDEHVLSGTQVIRGWRVFEALLNLYWVHKANKM